MVYGEGLADIQEALIKDGDAASQIIWFLLLMFN